MTGICIDCGGPKKTKGEKHPRCRKCAANARDPARCGWCGREGHLSPTCDIRVGAVEAEKRRSRCGAAIKRRRMTRIGNAIRRLREVADMSQEDLALSVGTTQGAVSCWETGRHEPSAANLIAIAEALGVDLMVLMNEIKKKQPA